MLLAVCICAQAKNDPSQTNINRDVCKRQRCELTELKTGRVILPAADETHHVDVRRHGGGTGELGVGVHTAHGVGPVSYTHLVESMGYRKGAIAISAGLGVALPLAAYAATLPFDGVNLLCHSSSYTYPSSIASQKG